MPNFFQTTPQHRTQAGQGMIEYAFVLMMVGVVVAVIMSLLGGRVGRIFERIGCQVMFGSHFVAYVDQGHVSRPHQTALLTPDSYYDFRNSAWKHTSAADVRPVADPYCIVGPQPGAQPFYNITEHVRNLWDEGTRDAASGPAINTIGR